MLARGLARQRAVRTRMALGATRVRLVRQRAVETMLLAAVGIGGGLLLGAWTVRLLASLAPPELSRTTAIVLDGRVLAVAALTTMVPMLAIAVVSATLEHRRQAGWSHPVPSRTTRRTQAMLVAGQTAAAVPLVVVALLLVASIVRLQAVDLGFEPRHVARMSVALPPGTSATPEAASLFHRTITPGYFRTMGMALRQGRDFTDADGPGASPVAIVNETMARMHWPGENAVGKRVSFEAVRAGVTPEWIEIVGVVADARHNRVDVPPRPEIYLPLARQPLIPSTVSLVVRGTGRPAELIEPLRRAILSLSGEAPTFEARTVTSIIQEATATPRYASTVVSLFAVLALALAAVGIHGLGALVATQRARETGIRMALGARRADIVRMMMRHGLAPAAIGLLIGSALAAMATRFVASLLYEVHPSDPVPFAAAAGALLIVAAGSSLVPALGAARQDPVSVLKGE